MITCHRGALVTSVVAIVSLTIFTPFQMVAQASADRQPALQQSDPSAILIVRKAIAAMGGEEEWRGVGAATAQVSISSPGLPDRTVQWSDDWSTGFVQSRRDITSADGHTSVMVSTEAGRSRRQASGNTQQLVKDNDIVRLAPGYPAAALILSLGRDGCFFGLATNMPTDQTPDDPSTKDQLIVEQCKEPFLATGVAESTWRFSSSSGLPLSVTLPIRGLLHNSILHEIISYSAFQQLQSLTLPAKLEITHSSGQSESVVISTTSLASSLPASTFQLLR